jgi:uncharacterized repeat protein (TIGR03803 family)
VTDNYQLAEVLMKGEVRSIWQVSWFWMASVLAAFAVALILPMPAAGKTYKVLHKFTGKDGANPFAALILDTAGNLYGTTAFGGAKGVGTVFKLAPNLDRTWSESVLHSFTGGSDGSGPNAGLIADSDGNLYGTTTEGGIINNVCNDYAGCGVVFKLTRDATGGWTESVLYGFCLLKNCSDGFGPNAAVTLDTKGNVYGTTFLGGSGVHCGLGPGCGTVFELTPNPHGGWTHSVLYNFCTHNNSDRDCTDSSVPLAAVIFDATGNLYGTTEWRVES